MRAMIRTTVMMTLLLPRARLFFSHYPNTLAVDGAAWFVCCPCIYKHDLHKRDLEQNRDVSVRHIKVARITHQLSSHAKNLFV